MIIRYFCYSEGYATNFKTSLSPYSTHPEPWPPFCPSFGLRIGSIIQKSSIGTRLTTLTDTQRHTIIENRTHSTTTSANVPWDHDTMMEWYIATMLSSRLILIVVGVSSLLFVEAVVEESKKCVVLHNDWSFIAQSRQARCVSTRREMDTVLNHGFHRTGWEACMDRSSSLTRRGALSISRSTSCLSPSLPRHDPNKIYALRACRPHPKMKGHKRKKQMTPNRNIKSVDSMNRDKRCCDNTTPTRQPIPNPNHPKHAQTTV